MAIPKDNDLLSLTKLELFSGCSLPQVQELTKGGLIRQLKHRQILYVYQEFADRFAVVLDGAMKLVKPTPRGDDVIVHISTPGDVIGAVVFTQGPDSKYPITAKAMGPTQVICIPRKTFDAHWMQNALLQTRLNALLYRRLAKIQDDKSLFRSPLQQRVAALLVRLIDENASREKYSLKIPITRQEIADSLGVSVESVIRIMSDWTQNSVIRSNGKQIEITNINEFLNIAGQR